MLRILSLNYEFPPIGGGGGNAHQSLLKALDQFDDLQVTLLSITDASEPVHESYSSHVELVLLPLDKKQPLFWRRTEVLKYILMHYGFLREHLKQVSYDLCHAFFGFPTGLLAYRFRSQMPYLISVRGSDVPGFNQRFSLDYVFLKPLLKRIYRSAQMVVANSTGLQTLFHTQFPSIQAQVIPNGIDTSLYQPLPKNESAEPSIVTVARLIPRKGIDLLIRACKTIEQEGIPFQCHIIGDGPMEKELKDMTADYGLGHRIHFHGQMSKGQIVQFLPRCDIFVLPSYAEGMSNAALEAMACGLPILLTETGGSRELIDGNGAIIPVGDVQTLENHLRTWLTDPAYIHAMGQRSRTCANAFSWSNVARRYHDLYYQVVGDKAN